MSDRDDRARAIFEELFGRKRQTIYRERDVPANQILQNLELLIERRMRWSSLGEDDKLLVEMMLAGYLTDVRFWMEAKGWPAPQLDWVDVNRVSQIEWIRRRRDLAREIEDHTGKGAQIRLALKYVKSLHEDYETLLYHDKRVDPELVERLVNTLKPELKVHFERSIRERGGPESHRGMNYLIEAPKELEVPMKPLRQQERKESATSLLPVTPHHIETYVRNYWMLDWTHSVLFWVRGQIERRIAETEGFLTEYGGAPKPRELEELETFMNGRHTEANLGRYLAVLDTLRLEFELRLREGKR